MTSLQLSCAEEIRSVSSAKSINPVLITSELVGVATERSVPSTTYERQRIGSHSSHTAAAAVTGGGGEDVVVVGTGKKPRHYLSGTFLGDVWWWGWEWECCWWGGTEGEYITILLTMHGGWRGLTNWYFLSRILGELNKLTGILGEGPLTISTVKPGYKSIQDSRKMFSYKIPWLHLSAVLHFKLVQNYSISLKITKFRLPFWIWTVNFLW